jgi:tetratricopeptide (TPR) repeat protein
MKRSLMYGRLIVSLIYVFSLNFRVAHAGTEPLPPEVSAATIDLRLRVDSMLQSHGEGHHLTREAWINLANHYTDVQAYKESAEVWKKIAESRANSLGAKSGMTADAFYHLGLMLEKSGQLDEAEAALEHCVSMCPIKPGDGGLLLDYYGLLSYVQCQLEHWAKARQTCRLWLTLRHTHVDTEAWAHRRLAYALAGEQAFEEAQREMELAMLRYPTWGSTDSLDGLEVHLDYARILRKGGKLPKAERLLHSLVESAAKFSPTDIPVTLQICQELAECLHKLGKNDAAIIYSGRAKAGLEKWKEMEPHRTRICDLHSRLQAAQDGDSE